MNVSSPAYSGIQDATQRLADIAQRASELSTASEPDLSVMPQSPSQKVTTRQTPEAPVETYNANGQVDQGRRANFEDMMVKRLQAEAQLQARTLKLQNRPTKSSEESSTTRFSDCRGLRPIPTPIHPHTLSGLKHVA